jgi:hypothetical protein
MFQKIDWSFVDLIVQMWIGRNMNLDNLLYYLEV